jgi:uroporphyrinogen decarboxylase
LKNKMRKEEMSPIERISALLRKEPIDRIPVYLWVMSSPFAAKNVGYSVADSYNDPEKSFWAQMWTQEMYGSDDLPRPFVTGTWDLTWAFGGQIKWPTGEYEQAPLYIRFPVESEDDALRLQLPRDLKTAGPNPLYMQFSKLIRKFIGGPIWARFSSSLEAVNALCGMDRLSRWLVKKPELVHRLLQLATDYSVELVRYLADTFGPEHIIGFTGSPVSSNQVISPKYFETFVLPYQKKLHDKILAMGIKHIFCHICGEQNLNLPYWVQIPMGDPGIVTFGHEVDLTTAIKYFGDKCIIAGNIEPAIIQNGTHEKVYELAIEAIEKAKYAPLGFILMPGCGLPPYSPPYNVFMMKKATNEFGWYD